VAGHEDSALSDPLTRRFASDEDLRVGERVRIHDGPLLGLEGSLVEQRSSRVVLSMYLLQSVALVEMDRSWVHSIAHPKA